MKLLLALALLASLAALANPTLPDPATGRGDTASAKTPKPSATLACGDSLRRADGTQRAGTPCSIAGEYCYEASGGAAFSHGAHCRALPKPGATCADLVAAAGAGASCTGTPATGLRVQFAFP